MANRLHSAAAMKNTFPMILAVALSACGAQSLVKDGTYVSDSSAALPDATLVVDLTAKTASVTLKGASDAIVLNLEAVAEADWERGCPTNTSSVAVETFTVKESPAVLGSLSLSNARLLAGCGLNAADPDTVTLNGTGEPNSTDYVIAFTRR